MMTAMGKYGIKYASSERSASRPGENRYAIDQRQRADSGQNVRGAGAPNNQQQLINQERDRENIHDTREGEARHGHLGGK